MTLFKGKIRKQHLYPFLYGISTIADECKLNIQPDGIYVKEVDSANVCLVDAKLPEHIFEQGSYQIKKPIVVGIDLEKYLHIFTDDEDKDCIFRLNLLEPVREDTPKLITFIDDENRFFIEDVRYEYTTLKIESIKRSPIIPDINPPLEITMPLKLFKRGIDVVDRVGSEHMYIGVNFNTGPVLFMKSHSDYDDIGCTKIAANRLPGFKYANYDKNTYPVGFNEIKTVYSMDYLKDILKGLSKYGCNNIKINLGTDNPVMISTNLGNNGPELKYMLAPRIEDD